MPQKHLKKYPLLTRHSQTKEKEEFMTKIRIKMFSAPGKEAVLFTKKILTRRTFLICFSTKALPTTIEDKDTSIEKDHKLIIGIQFCLF